MGFKIDSSDVITSTNFEALDQSDVKPKATDGAFAVAASDWHTDGVEAAPANEFQVSPNGHDGSVAKPESTPLPNPADAPWGNRPAPSPTSYSNTRG